MGQLTLTDPVLVALSGETRIIAEANFQDDPLALAQLWKPGRGYGEAKPLQVHLKFLYYIEDVIPPKPWVEPTA